MSHRSPKSVSGADTDEDVSLFRAAVRDVKPLRRASAGADAPGNPLGRAAPAADDPSSRPRRPRPAARFSRADRLSVLQESLHEELIDPALASGEELVFHRAGIQPAVLRKLRRGQYRVQAEIDLHGLTVAQAKQALRQFLAQALLRQWRCVRIVHGKGLRSGYRGPVLKGMVGATLRKLGPVLAYVSARQVDGGTGAVYVLLSS
ncbi:MAG TPA: Smr/MutS family protein [Steroidobacteraceae bacterium]|nr:Smr/MutS family protein [Steroidobacteraceae bacterium]